MVSDTVKSMCLMGAAGNSVPTVLKCSCLSLMPESTTAHTMSRPLAENEI